MNGDRSMYRGREYIVCYNCFEKGHIKRECRNPPFCQSCRQEHKFGSEECKNAWRYGQLSRDHRNNSYQQGSGNHYYNGYGNQYRKPQRGNFRGRGIHNQNYNLNYRPSSEDIRRHEENFNKVAENFGRVNTLTHEPEHYILDNYVEIRNWSVNDLEEYEEDVRND